MTDTDLSPVSRQLAQAQLLRGAAIHSLRLAGAEDDPIRQAGHVRTAQQLVVESDRLDPPPTYPS